MGVVTRGCVLSYDLVDQCEAVLPSGNCCKRKRRHAYLCDLAIGYRILDAVLNLMTYRRRLECWVRELCYVCALWVVKDGKWID